MEEFRDLYKNVLDNLYDGVYFVDQDRRVMYWNKAAERITGYAESEVVGRLCSDNILKHLDDRGVNLCEKACPLAESMSDGRPREADIFLHHKDGHRIPVSIRANPIRDAGGRTVGAVELFSDGSSKAFMRQRIQELEKMALIDPLTKLVNRRFLEMNLRNRLEEMHRYGWTMGILFIDVDHFKRINDRYGHPAGDEVLTMLGRTFSSNARPFDIFGRWGGEEFIAVVRNIDEKSLFTIGNRFRRLVETSSIALKEEALQVTVSIGATVARRGDTVESLVARADQLMYQSKDAGRNRISMDSGEHGNS
jgi:diguanylate cyclase (GGDEF)-like protein/PAS domain S-box-containing protein